MNGSLSSVQQYGIFMAIVVISRFRAALCVHLGSVFFKSQGVFEPNTECLLGDRTLQLIQHL